MLLSEEISFHCFEKNNLLGIVVYFINQKRGYEHEFHAKISWATLVKDLVSEQPIGKDRNKIKNEIYAHEFSY